MKTCIVGALAVAAALAISPAFLPVEIAGEKIEGRTIAGPTSQRAYQQLAVTCPKTGEQTSGMNKICFYNCVGSTTAITIGAAQLCPVFIQG